MKISYRLGIGASMLALLLVTSGLAEDKDKGKGAIKHVLLISVDGMHAVDFVNCANGVPKGASCGQ